MAQPTPISVTNVACSCGYLERSAQDSNLPVKFNAELDEYYLEHQLPRGTTVSIILYHCPMCGGVSSKSKRNDFFLTVTDAEVERLESLISGIKTVEDIRRVLGAPDTEETITLPSDFRVNRPPNGDIETGPVRVVTYTRLSATANIQFTVYSNSKVEGIIAPKQKNN